jgi:hypothetical protein
VPRSRRQPIWGVRQSDAATVLLETDDGIVRGDARVRVPRATIERVTIRDAVVTITSPSATVSLTLGAVAAEEWRRSLEATPKRLIDTLDVKPDATVWLLGVSDEMLLSQLRERTSNISTARSAADRDVMFVQVDRASQLARVDKPRAR